MKVAAFQGYGNRSVNRNNRISVSPTIDAVSSGDVPLEILRRRLNSVNSQKESDEIRTQIHHLQKVQIIIYYNILCFCIPSLTANEIFFYRCIFNGSLKIKAEDMISILTKLDRMQLDNLKIASPKPLSTFL